MDKVTVRDLLEYIKENDIPVDTVLEVQDFDNTKFCENIVLAFGYGYLTVSFSEEIDYEEEEEYESL